MTLLNSRKVSGDEFTDSVSIAFMLFWRTQLQLRKKWKSQIKQYGFTV